MSTKKTGEEGRASKEGVESSARSTSLLGWMTLPFTRKHASMPLQPVQRVASSELMADHSPSTSDLSEHTPPPPPRVTTKKGEQYIGHSELNRLLREMHDSYDNDFRVIKLKYHQVKEDNRVKTLELANLRNQRSRASATPIMLSESEEVCYLRLQLADALSREKEVQDTLDKLSVKHCLLLESDNKEPNRGIVNLTREFAEIRRFCESESKAKKALQTSEGLLRKELERACQDIQFGIDVNDELRADRDRLEALLNKQSEQIKRAALEMSQVCSLFEELQATVTADEFEVADKAQCNLLIAKYSQLKETFEGRSAPLSCATDLSPPPQFYDCFDI